MGLQLNDRQSPDSSLSPAVNTWLGLVVVLSVGAGLRMAGLGRRELWLDETSSFHIVTAGELLEQLTIAHTPPLYYAVLAAWTRVVGIGDALIRLPSAVFGVGLIAALYWAAKQVHGDRRAALYAAALAAVSPIHIYYSQEARAYALAVLCLALAYGALWRALRRNDVASWFVFAGCATAAVYAHYLSVFALVPSVFAVPRERLAGFVAAAAATSLAVAPWLLWSFVLNQHPTTGTAWIGELLAKTPRSLAIPKSLEILAIGSHDGFIPSRLKAFDWQLAPSLRGIGLAGFGLMAVAALVPPRRPGWPLAAIGFGALLLQWLVSLGRPVYVAGRYDLVALPALILLAAGGLSRLSTRSRVLALVAAIAIGVPTVVQLVRYHTAAVDGAKRELMPRFVESIADGDVLVTTSLRGLPTFYELHKLGFARRNGRCTSAERSFACVMYPRETELTPASLDHASIDWSPRAVRQQVDDILAARRSPSARVHLLFGQWANTETAIALDRTDQPLVRALADRGWKASAAWPADGWMILERGGADR